MIDNTEILDIALKLEADFLQVTGIHDSIEKHNFLAIALAIKGMDEQQARAVFRLIYRIKSYFKNSHSEQGTRELCELLHLVTRKE